MNLHDLPWLVQPSPQDATALKSVAGSGDPASISELVRLAKLAWPESQLRQLGRRVGSVIGAGGGDLHATAKAAGLSPFRLFVFSSATVSHIVDQMIGTALRQGILLEVAFCEYEQPLSWLERNAAMLPDFAADAVLFAFDSESLRLSPAIGSDDDETVVIGRALQSVERLAARVRSVSKSTIIVQTLAGDSKSPHLHMDAWLPGGVSRLRRRFNDALARSSRENAFVIFDAAAVAEAVGHSQWGAGRYSFIAKYPFATACIPLYTDRLATLIAAMSGKSKRVLVLDLDNTLWSGVIGDDGMDGIVLAAGNPKAEPHRAVQRMALAYKSRGVVLCISSKNTESVALEVLRSHPDMILREKDVAAFRINWTDKASNIAALAKSLDLGLESFVFLDDNPAERKQVRDALPQVSVPELPADPAEWLPVFEAAGYFEQVNFTAEDRDRAEYYKSNAQRADLQESAGDQEAFLRSLGMVMTVAPFDAPGRARIAQLIAKSNQFNTTTRRYSEAEVAALAADPGVVAMQVRLRDLFGDNGMISVVICRKDLAHWNIDLWLMSCRVLGRKVENAVLAELARRARADGACRLTGLYIPSSKNALVRDLYERLGFTELRAEADGTTSWVLDLAAYQEPELPIDVTAMTSQGAAEENDAE